MADEGLANRDLLACPLFSLEREGIRIVALYILYKLKKHFKGISVFGFIESVLKEFKEI